MLNRRFESHARSEFQPLEQLFRDLAAPVWGFTQGASLSPVADIHESETGLTLEVDLPGHKAEGIHVKVEQDVLTLRSERKREGDTEQKQSALRRERSFGVYERSFVLPRTVDATRIEARFDNGVLSLHLPTREESKPRLIEVKVHGQ